jgi:hypothetical protein
VSIIIDYAKEAIPGQAITKQVNFILLFYLVFSKILDNVSYVFTRTIDLASQNATPGTYNKIALKISALIELDLLKKLNRAQVTIQEVFSKGFGNLNETLTGKEVLI